MPTAYNISANEAGDIIALPKDCAFISINNPHEPEQTFRFADAGDILRLTFADITADVEVNGRLYQPITDGDARKSVLFIEERKAKNFIVHCTAGISRSGALCFYLHLKYGHALKPNFWLLSEPNPFVLGRLMIESSRPPGRINCE